MASELEKIAEIRAFLATNPPRGEIVVLAEKYGFQTFTQSVKHLRRNILTTLARQEKECKEADINQLWLEEFAASIRAAGRSRKFKSIDDIPSPSGSAFAGSGWKSSHRGTNG